MSRKLTSKPISALHTLPLRIWPPAASQASLLFSSPILILKLSEDSPQQIELALDLSQGASCHSLVYQQES